MLWVQPFFLTKLVMSSCVPPSAQVLVGKHSQLNYAHHNIECKVKLGVRDINFSTKYKLIINEYIVKHLRWEILISHPNNFGIYQKEKKFNTNWERQVYTKKSYFRFASVQHPIIILFQKYRLIPASFSLIIIMQKGFAYTLQFLDIHFFLFLYVFVLYYFVHKFPEF